MNILITSISRKVLLVKQFKRVATNFSDVTIFTGDVDSDAVGLMYSDKHLILPKDKDLDFIDKMLDICLENNIELIIPTRDEELPLFAKNVKKFNECGCSVLVSSLETINICQNKSEFFWFCEDNKINVPKTYWNRDDIVYPSFAKPVYGKASKGVFKMSNDEDLSKLNDGMIVQEYIDWQEYTIDLFSDFESNIISVIPRKRIKILNGESHIGETENNEHIINESINLANKLKLIGHNVIQCFYKDGIVKFIEVNPRYGGASNLSFKSGANTPEFLIKLLKGEKIKSQIKDFKDGLKMYRHSTDVFVNENISNKVFCIDIDGTICTEDCKYEEAKPITKVIDKINKLYEKNVIKLFTARGAESGFDWKPLTEKQLNEWGVKYHNLIMGKPYADYYVDNKAIDVLDWV